MRTYTEEEVARIAHLRKIRLELLSNKHPRRSDSSRSKIKAVTGELWQLTQNPAYR